MSIFDLLQNDPNIASGFKQGLPGASAKRRELFSLGLAVEYALRSSLQSAQLMPDSSGVQGAIEAALASSRAWRFERFEALTEDDCESGYDDDYEGEDDDSCDLGARDAI